MNVRRRILILLIALIALPGATFAQQQRACKEVTYQNHNQIDYSLTVQKVIGEVSDSQQVPIPKVCVALFGEPDHKLIVSAETDELGRFSLQAIPPGEYRLVSVYDPLCPANAILRVAKKSKNYTPLQVHMKPRGLDECSYAELGTHKQPNGVGH